MNKRTFLISAFAFVVIAGLSAAVTYRCFKAMRSGSMASAATDHSIGTKASQVLAGMDLSNEQQMKIKQLGGEFNKNFTDIQTQLATERISLCTLMMSTAAANAGVQPYIGRISRLETDQHRLVVEHLLSLKDVLNPEQNKKFFGAMMEDICQGCQEMCGISKDFCGMCEGLKG